LPGLKPLHQLTVPDERHQYFVRPDTLDPIAVEDHHADVAAVTISAAAPFEVREAFDRARNALLYGWYVYELGSLAESQAYSTLEMALRMRLGVKGGKGAPGLKLLLVRARDDGLLPHVDHRRVDHLIELVAHLRNTWNHGTSNLHDPGTTLSMLRTTADLINDLFP
jgi:hypothetical protein